MLREQPLRQRGEHWLFPHTGGGIYLSGGKARALVDTYTASYMRWKSKEHVLAWLRSFAQPGALRPVFLDVETTGTRRYSEIIEICIVSEEGKTLYHSLVKPTTEIEPIATSVHGLTWKKVKNAPPYPVIHEDVMRHLSNRVVIAYNVSFDIRLLRQTANRYQLLFPALHTGCLMYAYAKYRDVYVKLTNGQVRHKLYQLEEAVMNEQLGFPPSHRAERDAQCTHHLFHAMRGQINSRER